MKIGIPKEVQAGEARTPIVPDGVARLVQWGAQVEVESGLGVGSTHSDAAYQKAGAAVVSDRKALLSSADLVLRLRKPAMEEVGAAQARLHPRQLSGSVQRAGSGAASWPAGA